MVQHAGIEKMLYLIVAAPKKIPLATISWEGDSREVLRSWPKPIREDFGVSLGEMQEGRAAALPVRPMPSIAAGVFELKDSDESKWYRMVYLGRVENTIYVLHCFTKSSAKTDKRDLQLAERRWKDVQQRLREERNDEKRQQRGK
jgi:phage-related protein